jgi:hypothetical protein
LKLWFILILSIIPFSIYHIYGIFIDGFLKSQFSLRFFPALWGDTFFYRRWKDLIDSTLILELVLLSISGVILVQDKKKQIMLVSIWLGYLLFGMVFSYHIHTHDYYQLPMLPVIAMGLSAFVGLLMDIRVKRKLLTTLILLGLVLVWMVSNLTDTFLNFRSANYRQEKEFWSSIGERIKGKTVISMTQDYGYRLAYWGWTSSEHWLSSYDFEYRALAGTEMNQKDLFLEAIEGKDLFVVTVFSELEKQPFVKDTLYKEYAIFDQSDSYIIFDLNQPIKVK